MSCGRPHRPGFMGARARGKTRVAPSTSAKATLRRRGNQNDPIPPIASGAGTACFNASAPAGMPRPRPARVAAGLHVYSGYDRPVPYG
jgi:hypothetical protein